MTVHRNNNYMLLLTSFLATLLSLFVVSGQSINRDADLIETPVLHIDKPNVEQAVAADSLFGEPGMPFRIGIGQSADIDIVSQGITTLRPNGSKLVQLAISMKDAKAIALYFNDFFLDIGSKLTITDKQFNTLAGPYTYSDNPLNSNYYSSGLLAEDTVYLHLQTSRANDASRIHIYEVGFIYKDVFNKDSENISSGSCQVNSICSPEGDNWQDEKQGVARILIKIGSQYYLCSGSLVNNTSQDCTPYFLSAEHCGTGASATDLNQWVFYFNYEGLLCTSTGPQTTSDQVVGATKRASATNNIGSKSDMLLLELNQAVPNAYNPYYNGWDRNNIPWGSGVGIHHPAGDIKKISTYTSSLQNAANTHWEVHWVATSNGHGTTEGGSSGSPIFNSSGNIVGTLTGGYSSCSNLTAADYYGKFSYHWASNGSSASDQLDPWLDPGNTNLTTITGMYCNQLNAEFSASSTNILQGDTIDFTDLSVGSPTSWSWTFPGGSPASSSLQNPSVTYPTPGIYDVSLTATNTSGSSTETKTAYIIVNDPLQAGCDTLRWPFSGTPTQYTLTAGGYLCGNNVYGDLAKAEYFSGTDTNKQISGALIRFGKATGSGSFQVAIWDNSGSGGSPGSSPIATTTVNIASIAGDVQQNQYSYIPFSPAVDAGEDYYLGVILPTQNGDTIAIISSQAGQANPVTAWEQYMNGNWVDYNTSYSGSADVLMAISPVMCSSAIDSVYAGFMADTTVIPEGYTVSFTDTSSGTVQSRLWSFPGGNPSSSSDSIVLVTYNIAGNYDVSLAVTGNANSDSLSKSNLIEVKAPPVAAMQYSSLSVQAGNTLLFTSQSTGDDLNLSWECAGSSPASGSGSQFNPQFNDIGEYELILVAGSPWGDDDTATVMITVTDQLWGRVYYENQADFPVGGALVIFNDGTGNIDSTYANSEGYYGFSGLSATSGTLEAIVSIPFPGGAVNSTDALQIMRHFVGILTLSGINLLASDVDASGYTNATDALLTAQRFTGIITAFPAGDWLCVPRNATLSGGATRVDIPVIIIGDVNASWEP